MTSTTSWFAAPAATLGMAALMSGAALAMPTSDNPGVEGERFRALTLVQMGYARPTEVDPKVTEIFGPAIAAIMAIDPTVSFRPMSDEEKSGKRLAIVVDIAEKRLTYYRDGYALDFPVATARPGVQKYGNYSITLKRDQPTWIPTKNQRKLYPWLPGSVPPGPLNPLGSKALNLSSGNLRIHGTNRSDQIGLAVSDGCVRMFNAHIDALFELIKVGDRVAWVR